MFFDRDAGNAEVPRAPLRYRLPARALVDFTRPADSRIARFHEAAQSHNRVALGQQLIAQLP